jgi:hypothetical protein
MDHGKFLLKKSDNAQSSKPLQGANPQPANRPRLELGDASSLDPAAIPVFTCTKV